MKVLFLDTPLVFYLIPREDPLETDTLTLAMRNEITGKIITPVVNFELINKDIKITIPDQPEDFSISNKYEIELINNSIVIYRGKLIILAEGTDIQNYNYSSQPNAKFDYKK